METCLFGLIKDGILGNHTPSVGSTGGRASDEQHRSGEGGKNPTTTIQITSTAPTNMASSLSSPFFAEQLTAFEVWLQFAPIRKMYLKEGAVMDSPEQLPVVLQVLLSQVHRIRALRLLKQFLDLGPWAVNLALSLGIFPYVMKLLQSPEYKSLLVSIWASILAFDSSCQVDLVKDGALPHFIQHLNWGMDSVSAGEAAMEAAKERTLASFILAVATHKHPQGQTECSTRLNLCGTISTLLSSYEAGENVETVTDQFRMWLCLCLANMVQDNRPCQNEAFNASVHIRLFARINDTNANVRAAACFALGCLMEASKEVPPSVDMTPSPMQRMAPGPMFSPTGVSNGAVGGQLPVSLQPSFASAPMSNLHWRPQHQPQHPDMTLQQQLTGSNSLQVAGMHQIPMHPQGMQTTGHLLNHAALLHPPQSQPFIQGAIPIHPGVAPNPGFMVGSGRPSSLDNSVFSGGSGQPVLIGSPPMHQMVEPTVHRKSSVFDDRPRMELDLTIMEVLLKAAEDGSSVVRYEATIALASAVEKFTDAFLHVADEHSARNESGTETGSSETKTSSGRYDIDLHGLDPPTVDRFLNVWKTLRELQHRDPNPAVAKLANSIVCYVFEHLLQRRLDSDKSYGGDMSKSERLIGIDEESQEVGSPSTHHKTEAKRPPQTDGPPHRLPQGQHASSMRRVVSELESGSSMERSAILAASLHSHHERSKHVSNELEFNLPKSKFYSWKRSTFMATIDAQIEEKEEHELDPLSPEGATGAYRANRNRKVHERGNSLASHFVSLAPKPPKPKKPTIVSIEDIIQDEAAEAEDDSDKKRELEMKEKKLLRNDGVKMTSMLKFHAYEDILVACGSEQCLSVWDTERGFRSSFFKNGNPKGSRMTTANFINEATTSLFLVGCDDGSARIWDGIVENNGEACTGPPALVSAFFAASDMTAGQRGSGLVCEWQQYSGTLIAGGNSKYLRCWDLEAEKCGTVLETNTEACITTLTTAWDYEYMGLTEQKGFQGIGPHIVVAGQSDGVMKVFDIRTNKDTIESPGAKKSWASKRKRPDQYAEHSSWIVYSTFAGYGGRYELISGSVAGDIKVCRFWEKQCLGVHHVSLYDFVSNSIVF